MTNRILSDLISCQSRGRPETSLLSTALHYRKTRTFLRRGVALRWLGPPFDWQKKYSFMPNSKLRWLHKGKSHPAIIILSMQPRKGRKRVLPSCVPKLRAKTAGKNNGVSTKLIHNEGGPNTGRGIGRTRKNFHMTGRQLTHIVSQFAYPEVRDGRKGLAKNLHFCDSTDGGNKYY